MRPLVVLFVTLGAALLAGRSALASMTDSDWGRLQSGVVVEADGAFAPGEPFRVKEIDVHDQQVPGPGIELIGRLDAVDGEARTITLLGVVVSLTDSTTVRREDRTGISAADLVPGDWLEVDALAGQDGTLVADRVKRYDADPGKQQIEGTVTTVDPSRRRLTIGPVETRVSKTATIRGGVVLAVPRSIDDDYDPRAAWSAFGGKLSGGGRFQYEIEPETEFDLDPARQGNRTRSNWTADLHVDARFAPWLEAFAKAGQRGLRVIFDDEGDEVNASDWTVQQAYALLRPRPLVALQVGRQNFDEPREWLYDENLDAVRLRLAHGAWRGETSAATRRGTASARLADRTNWIFVLGREMARAWLAEGYWIHRSRGGTGDDHPTWIGLRSHGRLASGWNHWLELSALRATLFEESTTAWAVDGGLRVRLVRRLGLEVTGAWAWGSGGPATGDRYLQTGLNDNNDKLGGVTSFKYYGELLDPELSNLAIATAAAGFRPTKQSSVDVLYHAYRQPHPEQRLFGTNLETRPRGGNGDVGTEWDLVVGFEEISSLDIEYVYGTFDPGGAFAEGAARAHFHKLSLVLTL